MKKQTFLGGSLVLIASAAISKTIGAIFRIPLANMLGGTGMGYFSYAYGIFTTVYALCITGLPVASARLTAECTAKGNLGSARKVRRTALLISAPVGLICTVLMLLLSYPFCVYIGKNTSAVFAVAAIAPSVLFGCITAVYRGCFEGQQNMFPTAVSQVIEASVKLVSGLALCYAVLNAPESFFIRAYDMLGRIPFDGIKSMSPSELVLPLAAAGAVLGVTISAFAGTVYIFIRNLCENKSKRSDISHESTKAVAREFLSVMIPAAAGSLVTNLTTLIDLGTITSLLTKALSSAPERFSSYISAGVNAGELPAFLFGSFTGLAVTVFNLIPSFTNMFGKGIIPRIADGCSAGDTLLVRQSAMNVIFTASYIAIPAGIGISSLAPEILHLLFPKRPLEVQSAVLPLRILGIGVIFLSVSSVLFSVLQASGREREPVKIMAAGVAVKLLLNVILVPIPSINTSGAAIATTACYLCVMLLSVKSTANATNINEKDVYTLMAKLTFGGILCSAAAVLSENLLGRVTSSPFTLIISVLLGVIFYIIITHLMGVLTKSTVKLLIC